MTAARMKRGNISMEVSTKAIDPVCKMEGDPKTAGGTSVYKGQTFYFCGAEDKKTFDQNPEKYVGQK